jgi:hypothetical protein
MTKIRESNLEGANSTETSIFETTKKQVKLHSTKQRKIAEDTKQLSYHIPEQL